MNYLINMITGAPESAQTLESIQKAIDELHDAMVDALEIREVIIHRIEEGT